MEPIQEMLTFQNKPQKIAACIDPGGRIANMGVNGKLVEFHIERLWSIPSR
jgi:hypothetical protein